MNIVPSITATSPLNMATHTAEVNAAITDINTNFTEVRPAMSFNNVTITNTSTVITLASGALIGLRNSTGTWIINILTSADITLTPTLAATTPYYLWLVHTASTNTTALLLTTSYTAPSYDYYRYLGGRFTDSSSRLYIIKQVGNECSYVVDGTILTGLRQITSGIAGNVVTPTYTPVQINMFVPNTAYKIKGVLTNSSGASSITILAPNDKYGTYASSTNPPPGAMYPNVSVYNLIFDFLLESMNIYYASDNANAHVWCFGWVDNL